MTNSPHEALVTDVGKALMANDAESIDHQARAVLRVIYVALLEPTPEMLEASILVDELATCDWQAMLKASPLVKPWKKTPIHLRNSI